LIFGPETNSSNWIQVSLEGAGGGGSGYNDITHVPQLADYIQYFKCVFKRFLLLPSCRIITHTAERA
jgi:hypothetical protein